MKVKLTRSIGSADEELQKELGGSISVAELSKHTEGDVCDVPKDAAEVLLKRNLATTEEHQAKPAAAPGTDLESMTVEELHALASKEGINLHGATIKADIIKAIKKAK